jgi:glycosyltransferase involved in cell wall biosynthesis
MLPTVSICIPTYNQTKFLVKTIDSVIFQNYKDYEIIVSDDSTNDDVKNLIISYQKRGIRLNYFQNKPSLGSPKNWNFAVSKANGKYIKIMHHDEWFETPSSLSKLVEVIEENPNTVVFSAAYSINKGMKRDYIPKEDTIERINFEPIELIINNYIGCPSALIYPRNCSVTFDENYIWLVDVDFYIHLLEKKYKFIYIKECLYTSMIDEHNITNNCLDNFDLQLDEYSRLYLKYVSKKSFLIRYKYMKRIQTILKRLKPINLLQLALEIKKRKL